MKRVMLAAMLASACGSASAAVVTFTNTDPDFVLHAFDVINEPPNRAPWQVLDITQPVTNQPALETNGPAWGVRIEYVPPSPGGYSYGSYQYLDGNNQARVAWVVAWVLDGYDGSPYETDALHQLGPGDVVGPALTWLGKAIVWHRNPSGTWHFVAEPGSTTFAGIEITLPDGVHYGFVELERISLPNRPNFPFYRPVSWGYETEVGVPLVIVPAPSAAALLLGAGLVARRRR